MLLVTHSASSRCVGRVISRICHCLCVRAKRKRQAISRPTLTEPQYALTLRSKGQGQTVIKCAASLGMYVDITA